MTQHLAWLGTSQAQDPQNSRLRLQIRQVCATVGSPVSVCLHLVSIDEQSHWLGLLLGKSVCQDPRVLVAAGPFLLLCCRFSVVGPKDDPAIPCSMRSE